MLLYHTICAQILEKSNESTSTLSSLCCNRGNHPSPDITLLWGVSTNISPGHHPSLGCHYVDIISTSLGCHHHTSLGFHHKNFFGMPPSTLLPRTTPLLWKITMP
ncbi:unnamed protein product [Callosobruchus maculatus]|uniref:Uncharacterized protein n=1 Tax=Callosobruchus maculatus TaxID=64391 RepID=A0A653CL03_CALMS|nr:unnamed protein product [Callosobruchus maculatus]